MDAALLPRVLWQTLEVSGPGRIIKQRRMETDKSTG